MGRLSNIIQKIEGYDWEEGRDFDVTVISVADNEEGRYEVTLRQLKEKDRNPVETLINRLRSYSTDKEIYAIVSLRQSQVPYEWHVELVADKNEGYKPVEKTEGDKPAEEAEEDK